MWSHGWCCSRLAYFKYIYDCSHASISENFPSTLQLSESSIFFTTHILSILKLHSFHVASCIHLHTTYDRDKSDFAPGNLLSEHTQESFHRHSSGQHLAQRQSFPVYHSSQEIEDYLHHFWHITQVRSRLRTHTTDSTLQHGSDQVRSRCDASRHNQDRWCIRTHRESTLRVTP